MNKIIKDFIVEGQFAAVSVDATVCDAISAFSSLKSDYVLVRDGDAIKGIFTESDLSKRIVCGHQDVAKTKIVNVMTSKMICADLNTDIDSCMFIMMRNRIKHLPIRNLDGKVCAVAGVLDLLRAKFEEVQEFQQASNIIEANDLIDREEDVIAKSMKEYLK